MFAIFQSYTLPYPCRQVSQTEKSVYFVCVPSPDHSVVYLRSSASKQPYFHQCDLSLSILHITSFLSLLYVSTATELLVSFGFPFYLGIFAIGISLIQTNHKTANHLSSRTWRPNRRLRELATTCLFSRQLSNRFSFLRRMFHHLPIMKLPPLQKQSRISLKFGH